MHTRLFAVLTVLPLFLSAGCAIDGADAGESESEAPEQTTSAISATSSFDVTWNYKDRVGRGIQTEANVPGRIRLQLIGAPLPVAGSATPLQTAILTLDLPSFDSATRSVRRRFYVRYEVKSTPAGGTRYGLTPFSNASIVDADLPNASALFDSTYDSATQRAKELYSLPGEISGVSFAFEADAAGKLKPTTPFYIGTFARERNFAWHYATIALEQ